MEKFKNFKKKNNIKLRSAAALTAATILACTMLAGCGSDKNSSDASSSAKNSSAVTSSANSSLADKTEESSSTADSAKSDDTSAADSTADPAVEGKPSPDNSNVIVYEPEKSEDELTDDEISVFEGKIPEKWTDVKGTYEQIENSAKDDSNVPSEITKDTLKEQTDKLSADYEKIKDGITDSNKSAAEDAYEAASKLEYWGEEKYPYAKDSEIVRLSKNMKKFIKHLYGEAEDDFNVLKSDIEISIDSVNNYSDEDWAESVELYMSYLYQNFDEDAVDEDA